MEAYSRLFAWKAPRRTVRQNVAHVLSMLWLNLWRVSLKYSWNGEAGILRQS